MTTTQDTIPVEHPTPPPSRREVWQLPWGWPEAFLLQAGLLFVAFCVEYVLHRKGITLIIPFPLNWILLGGFVLGVMAVGFVGRRDGVIRWLSGVQFAVAGITFYTLLGLTGILIAQGHTHDPLSEIGLRELFTSLPFLVASLLIMLNLAMVIGRRFAAPRPGFIGFMLNHFGLLLVMGGIIAGSAQIQKPQFALFTNQSISSVDDDERKLTYHLGGSITLNRFNIDYYPAKASLFAIDMQAMMHGGEDFHVADQALVSKGHVFTAYGMSVTVEEYLASAYLAEDGAWQESPHHGLAAVKVSYTTADGAKGTGWIAEGMENILKIGDSHVLMLRAHRMPKRYQSFVTIAEDGKKPVETVIEVNKPARVGPWRLYQSSYDQDNAIPMYTVLQAVKDPALPVVYTGLVCMVLGAFIACWAPRRKSEENAEEAA